MKLENQVCSLEQAKRLKELGIEQDSYLFHVYPYMNSGWKIYPKGMWDENDDAVEYYSAFATAELGQMLPPAVTCDNVTCYWFTNKSYCGKIWYLPLMRSGKLKAEIELSRPTEAEARAAMLIYILENNLATAAECNARLNA